MVIHTIQRRWHFLPIAKARGLRAEKLMNYIIKDENALFYECGYSCDNAIFLKLGSDSFFITDGRYTIDAKENIKNARVIQSQNLIQETRILIRKANIKKLYYDPKEWSSYEFNLLKDKLNRVSFFAKVDFSKLKRAIKSDNEIKIIKKAVKLGRDGFKKFAKYLKNSGELKSEKFLQYKLKSILASFGELDLSFEPILAINENSAKPHAIASKRVLQNGDLLLVDAGIKYKRYCSDRTRTSLFNNKITFKERQKFSNKKRQKIYDTVLKAHDKAIIKAKSGVMASEIDKIARDVIDKAGFAKFFVHSTGHGVGLNIHEYPFISAKSDMLIEDNMVFTIEPGIYIPNEFGVRIEDMVVMKNGVAKVL